MDKTQFKSLIRECIVEVIKESSSCGCGCPDCDHKKVEEKKWIQKAVDPKHKGYCTPMTKSTCTPARKALAKRFKSGDLSEDGMKMKAPEAPKIRKTWGDMNPTTRVHGAGKQGFKPKYDRKRDQGWKNDLEEHDEDFSKDPGGFIAEEYETLFSSGRPEIPIDELENIALKYVKDAGEAQEAAMHYAFLVADKLSYEYDENKESFCKHQSDIKEMTTTAAVQGFYGKNWCDPDPKRKKMKSIATKSVGGDLA